MAKAKLILTLILCFASSSASSFSIAKWHGLSNRAILSSAKSKGSFSSHQPVIVSTLSVLPSVLSDAAPAQSAVAAIKLVPTLDAFDPCQAWTLVLAASIVTVILAVAQGAAATIRYRRNFGDAPAPRVPCHGVVIVRPLSKKLDKQKQGNEPPSPLKEFELPNARDCLRLLVIGDSLAVGVGQFNTAYPVLPEEIAKELSKRLGKPVYWTCCGESGASTQWITRMLQQSDEADVGLEDDEQYGLEGNFVEVLEEKAQSDKCAGTIDQKWRKELNRYRKFFNPENLRLYDVVVLVTGPNDLKSLFLPFILDEEDRKLREQRKGASRDEQFIADIRLFIRTLNTKMEQRIEKFRQGLEIQVGRTLQDLRESLEELAEILNVNMDDYFDQIFGPRGDLEQLRGGAVANMTMEDASFHTLFVLPASPVRLLPSLREMIPLRWFAVPIFDAMNRKKENFAKSNPDSVLYVDGLSFSSILEFEENRGQLWKESKDEEVILALRDIGPQEGKLLEDAMYEYYSSKQVGFLKPGTPGWKSFCIDGIHPREIAYTAFGELKVMKNLRSKSSL